MDVDTRIEKILDGCGDLLTSHATVRIGRCELRLAAAEPWVVPRLADGLGPQLRVLDSVPHRGQGVRIEFLKGSDLLTHLSADLFWTHREEIGLYGRVIGCRAATAERFTLVQHDGSVTVWDGVERRLILIYGEKIPSRHHFEHHVKLPLKQALRMSGCASIHCSSVVVEGRAVLFAASSGAGKSTLLAAMLAGGARYLGSDVAFVDTMMAPFRVLAWPHPIRFGPGTVQASGWLSQLESSVELMPRLIRLGSDIAADGKLELRATHLAAIFGEDFVCREAPFGEVIIPSLDLSASMSSGHWSADPGLVHRVRRQLLEERPGFDWIMTVDARELAEMDMANATRAVNAFDDLGLLEFGAPHTRPEAEIHRMLSTRRAKP